MNLLHLRSGFGVIQTFMNISLRSKAKFMTGKSVIIEIITVSKGRLNSESIYEVIVSPKMPTKNLRGLCPGSLLEGKAEILQIFGWHFEKNDNLLNSFSI